MKIDDIEVPEAALVLFVWVEQDENGAWQEYGVSVPSIWSYISHRVRRFFMLRRLLGG